MSSFSIQNFGCRVNQAEAFSWAEEFQRRGFRLEMNFLKSDIVIVNTCTLTSRADRDVRRFIRKMADINPAARLLVAGCLVERSAVDLEGLPNVAGLIKNNEKEKLPEWVFRLARPSVLSAPVPFRSRALLKVQDGCDFQCAFCVIPPLRGKSVSLAPGLALARFEDLAARGFREIVLTGIHLSSYGLDLEPKDSLQGLLERIEERKRPVRVRLSSLDPRFLDKEFLDFLAGARKICPHFHLSLQHGSDEILRRMGRRSRVTEYEDILAVLRDRIPEASLGADIIVGFPGETEEDFKRTYDFVARSPLTTLHVFSYSPRPGTPAARLPQVAPRVKKDRTRRLRTLAAEKNRAFRRSFLGRELEGIVIRPTKEGAEVLTSNYFRVLVPPGEYEPGGNIRIRLVEVKGQETHGMAAGEKIGKNTPSPT